MKIEDMDIYDLPIWACAVVDEIDETCRKRLKASLAYSRILKESDELLFKYPFISKIIDRDEINEPMELSVEKAKALSRFLELDADREDYERVHIVAQLSRQKSKIFIMN